MSAITMYQSGYKTFTGYMRRNLLMEKLKNLITENSAIIVCGLMMLNGSGNMSSVYEMLNRQGSAADEKTEQ